MPGSFSWRSAPLDSQLPAMSILGRRVRGRPAPVWSLAAADLALALVFALGSFRSWFHPHLGGDYALAVLAALYWLASAVGLMWLGRRTSMWLLNVLLAISSVALGLLATTRPDDIRAGTVMVLYVVIVAYAATWLPPVEMWLQFALVFVMMCLVVVLHDFSLDTRTTWIVLSVILVFLGVFINALVRDMHKQAVLDPLTGLLNRAGLELLAESRSGDRSEGPPLAVVVLDLDGFKSVNDRLGHHAGDDILRQVGHVLRHQLRPSDSSARVGGDEFVILLPSTTEAEAGLMMSRLVTELPVGCSFGIAEWSSGRTFVDAAKLADARMFENKAHRAG